MAQAATKFARDIVFGAPATGTTNYAQIYFPKKAIITDVSFQEITGFVAHASNKFTLTVTDRSTDGSGTTVVALVTNDTAVTSGAVNKSAALVAKVALNQDLSDVNTSVAQGLSGTAVAAGALLEVKLVNSTGSTLSGATATIHWREGTN